MRWLPSRWLKLFGLVAVLALVVSVGFLYSRGYLLTFSVDGQALTRDEFLQLVEQVNAEQSSITTIACTPRTDGILGLPIGNVCFSNHEALEAFMSGNAES